MSNASIFLLLMPMVNRTKKLFIFPIDRKSKVVI